MSKIQFAIIAALIITIGTLVLAPTAKAQRYSGTTWQHQAQENTQRAQQNSGQ
jgi:hypothetical protein